MSYGATLVSGRFAIHKDNHDDAFHRAIAGLKYHNAPVDYRSLVSLEDILDEVHFNYTIDHNENILLTGFDHTVGFETVVLESIAPCVSDGSWMNWEEEDGAIRRDEIVDGAYIFGDPEYLDNK